LFVLCDKDGHVKPATTQRKGERWKESKKQSVA